MHVKVNAPTRGREERAFGQKRAFIRRCGASVRVRVVIESWARCPTGSRVALAKGARPI